ncbi:MAG: hypothetical protein KJO46_01480 [Gammaproteobacteria bacterium]|nr:hypothetical protein [Gammaproteobacteria bacterium]
MLFCAGACQSESPPPPATADLIETAQSCGEQGFLSATLFGSIEREFDWSADELECENMARPDGEGLRLRFTGAAANRSVSIILALPDLKQGEGGSELPTVVTLTVEGSGRFFSTADLDSCFTDIRARPSDGETNLLYDARGTLFCIEPLGEINGDAAVSIPQLEFQTRIEWSSDDA